MQQVINIPEGFELVQTSETTFEIKKKKHKLPKTWKEFCDTHVIKDKEAFIDNWGVIYEVELTDVRRPRGSINNNLLPTKSDAEGILALIQLIQLRDCYNNGWRADWTCPTQLEGSDTSKYVITREWNRVVKDVRTKTHAILSFKSKELLDEFYSNFKNLIETAKDFI